MILLYGTLVDPFKDPFKEPYKDPFNGPYLLSPMILQVTQNELQRGQPVTAQPGTSGGRCGERPLISGQFRSRALEGV